MIDKFIRLLKAIGIALLLFGAGYLIVCGFIKHGKIMAIIILALIFIYKDGEF